MHRVLSVKLSDLNNHLKCPICKGYLIDSYTINECLHSFCKSCIIKYIKRKECCPVCKINIIKERMNVFLKRDVNLQCIVYKLVPGLFKNEMNKRREFYSAHPKALKCLKKKNMFDKEAIGELDEAVLSSDYQTDISLSVEYSDTGLPEIFDSARTKELDPNAPKTYLLCPSSLTINVLKKFISNRFDNKSVNEIDIMYDDKPLNEELTLLDIAYIYAWRRTAPMRLFFRYTGVKPEAVQSTPSNQVLAQIDNNKLPTTTNEVGGNCREEEKEALKLPVRSPEKTPPVMVEDSCKENRENIEEQSKKVEETKQLIEESQPTKEIVTTTTTTTSETPTPKPIGQETCNESVVLNPGKQHESLIGDQTTASAKTSLISTSTTHPTTSDSNSLTITAMVASIVQEVKSNKAAAAAAVASVKGAQLSDKENEPSVLKTTTTNQSSNNSPLVGNNKLLNETQTSSVLSQPLPIEVAKPTPATESTPAGTPQQGGGKVGGAVKRPKLIKPKTDGGDNKEAEVVDQVQAKKKKARTPMENTAKKPRLSKQSNKRSGGGGEQQTSIPIKTEAEEPTQPTTTTKPNNPSFPVPQIWPVMNQFINHLVPNKPPTPSTQQSQPQQQQQQQHTPEQQQNYWKSAYNYSASPNNGDYKPLPSISNAFKYHTFMDYIQNKAVQQSQHHHHQSGGYAPHQSLFGAHHAYNPTSAAAAAVAMVAAASQYHQHHHQHHHYPYQQQNQQFNYIDETFKKPTSSSSPAPLNPFASFIQDYQTSLFNSSSLNAIQHNSSSSMNNRSFTERNNTSTNNDSSSSSGLESLKETQLKISESCSLVNEAN